MKNIQYMARCQAAKAHVWLLDRLHVAHKNNTKIEMIYS